jgi:hypothetical protein
LIDFFGRGDRRRWKRKALDEVAIPEPAKRFLNKVGLPSDDLDELDAWLVHFDGEDTDELPWLRDRPPLRVIGFSAEVSPICLDEDHGGRVVIARRSGVRFVNSTVEQFGQFLYAYHSCRSRLQDVQGWKGLEGVEKAIDSLERRMRKLDPPAFADRRHLWPGVIRLLHSEDL